jgi:hypothetical protein
MTYCSKKYTSEKLLKKLHIYIIQLNSDFPKHYEYLETDFRNNSNALEQSLK